MVAPWKTHGVSSVGLQRSHSKKTLRLNFTWSLASTQWQAGPSTSCHWKGRKEDKRNKEDYYLFGCAGACVYLQVFSPRLKAVNPRLSAEKPHVSWQLPWHCGASQCLSWPGPGIPSPGSRGDLEFSRKQQDTQHVDDTKLKTPGHSGELQQV